MKPYILAVSAFISGLGAVLSYTVIVEYIPIFIRKNLYGRDQCKPYESKIPEPIGVISASVYLLMMIIFIPFPFYEWISNYSAFPHERFLSFLSALLSIGCAILLGFADDVLDLRWRHKLFFPTISSLPILLVYSITGSSTTVLVPKCLSSLEFLSLPEHLDIGPLYYIYMGMMIVFCTNAINIFAGVNGLEVGQSVVIAVSVAIFNAVQLVRLENGGWHHSLSLYFLLPFIAINIVLLYFNWYPARVFVGDTFCYWAGMTLATTCVLGHFSKTMLLFLVPQVFNFLYSLPQLFHLIPCPRHRLPKYNSATDKVEMSCVQFKVSDLSSVGKHFVTLSHLFGLLHKRAFKKDHEDWLEINNLTILNLALKFLGPMNERSLTICLLLTQVFCSFLAFFIRFYFAGFIYDVVE
ncbi:hypothetical protein AB6A40_000902 [Gnathostoma spinigerum]|uniref:UDP-N-acetylglucosamine--dolichyl-phosphate N-acetylglucosaminephosphotransferase n=1 Tax=Gnathostoma spinigerum TaxID=75299 RepID=A0ABD6E347_9BILA